MLEAGEATGELAWRLPLHEEYKDLTRGSITDLINASEKRKASTIYAASFLEEFVDSKPWAHLDIAGTAWDVGREYVGKGATGYRRAPAGRAGARSRTLGIPRGNTAFRLKLQPRMCR